MCVCVFSTAMLSYPLVPTTNIHYVESMPKYYAAVPLIFNLLS